MSFGQLRSLCIHDKVPLVKPFAAIFKSSRKLSCISNKVTPTSTFVPITIKCDTLGTITIGGKRCQSMQWTYTQYRRAESQNSNGQRQ